MLLKTVILLSAVVLLTYAEPVEQQELETNPQLEAVEDSPNAAEEEADLKAENTFGWGWGYRPRYYSSWGGYRPRYYSSYGSGRGWGGGWGGSWGGYGNGWGRRWGSYW